MLTRKVSFLGLISLFLAGIALGGQVIPNWPAPATWSPARAHGGLTTMGDATPPLPFIGANPCRIADTRTAPGPYGAPSLTGGAPRNFTLTGQCGIPAEAAAVSLNVTVTNTQGPGFILIYPQGSSQPMVSTLNYVANQTIANAAVVPLGGGGITVIAGVSGTDLILDTNGYYSDTPASQDDFFLRHSSNGSVIKAENLSTTCSGPCGILSLIFGDGGSFSFPASAMTGNSIGSLVGVSWGVSGVADTTGDGSTGVFGQDATHYRPPASVLTFRAGVQGTSIDAIGVVGQSRKNCVVGQLRDNSDNPSFYGILGATFGTAGDSTTGPWGIFSGGNFGATGAKHFVEPHPSDPTKVILYSSLEGREVGTYFRARARCVNGMATVAVPEDFATVTDENDLSVQATAIGKLANFAVQRLDLSEVVLECSRNVEVFVTVNGVRRAFRDFEPVAKGMEFAPRSADERMPLYLTEEAKRRLIANGTYNADGTVNMETAERVGWTKMWADREAQAKAAAAANAAANAARWPERK